MKSLTECLWFEVPGRRGFINITPKVEELVTQSGVREGLWLVNAMHITASVFINDDESGLHHDYEVWLEKLAPHAPTSAYRHNRTGEDNADAHLKRQIMGREVVSPVAPQPWRRRSPWEQIFYGEFHGRRRKRALVKIIGESMITMETARRRAATPDVGRFPNGPALYRWANAPSRHPFCSPYAGHRR
jgi:secondary thiamine-phosphate synthase enzyme